MAGVATCPSQSQHWRPQLRQLQQEMLSKIWWASARCALPALASLSVVASNATSSGTVLLAYITKGLSEVSLGLTNSLSSESCNLPKMVVREDSRMNPQGLFMTVLHLQMNSYDLQADVPNLLAQAVLLALLVVLSQIPS